MVAVTAAGYAHLLPHAHIVQQPRWDSRLVRLIQARLLLLGSRVALSQRSLKEPRKPRRQLRLLLFQYLVLPLQAIDKGPDQLSLLVQRGQLLLLGGPLRLRAQQLPKISICIYKGCVLALQDDRIHIFCKHCASRRFARSSPLSSPRRKRQVNAHRFIFQQRSQRLMQNWGQQLHSLLPLEGLRVGRCCLDTAGLVPPPAPSSSTAACAAPAAAPHQNGCCSSASGLLQLPEGPCSRGDGCCEQGSDGVRRPRAPAGRCISVGNKQSPHIPQQYVRVASDSDE